MGIIWLALKEDFMGKNLRGSPGSSEVVPVPGRGEGQVATLAGGCFWCLEPVFDELKGVESVESGYTGGQVPNPTYARVCDGDTGHAEAVQVTFNPQVLSYHDMLTVFFAIHDPTTLNRQGADAGTQYRSAIFYHDEQQREIARQVIQEIADAHIWDNPIVTEITPFDEFYPAEDYHQEYFAHNAFQPYCRAVIAPKISKFRKQFGNRLRKSRFQHGEEVIYLECPAVPVHNKG
jgi:peptide-methionine (S)-S-oxide reductase